MKFLLMMSGTQAGVAAYKGWSEKDMQAHYAFLGRLNQDLRDSGEFVATQPLSGPEEARVVRAGKDGMPVTDGVFPESKEFLLGYWIVDVASAERAYEIAARLSSGPGPGGVATNMPIEVRRFLDARTSQGATR